MRKTTEQATYRYLIDVCRAAHSAGLKKELRMAFEALKKSVLYPFDLINFFSFYVKDAYKWKIFVTIFHSLIIK